MRESKFTEKLGILILQNEIKKKLDSEYGVDIQGYEMGGIIKDKIYKKYGQNIEKSSEIIENIMENHVENIKKVMRKNKFNIEGLPYILLVGGGSLVLKEYLRKVFPQAVMISDPVYANVKGFYEVGKILYAENI